MEKIQEAVGYIRSIFPQQPEVGIVLGSGLGNFASEIKIEKEISYADIPNFPQSTVKGHGGKLIFGEIGGKKVAAMSGRFHFYEGYDVQDVVLPVRVFKFLGVKTLLLSNAAGATNPGFKVGDIMIINDHISFFTPNPLVGKNDDSLGPRFPDMSEPYDKKLIELAKRAAQKNGIDVKEGVYVAVTGPTFETKAEYRMIHTMGADAVGMSTVQETITAVHMGMPVLAMSVITDLGIGDHAVITHEEVLQAAKEAEPKLAAIFKEVIALL